jgi:hypothetical protein
MMYKAVQLGLSYNSIKNTIAITEVFLVGFSSTNIVVYTIDLFITVRQCALSKIKTTIE